MRLLPVEKSEGADFIQLPDFAALGLALIIQLAPLAEFFQDADGAVGFDQRQTPPFTFALDLRNLLAQLQALDG